MNQCAVIENGTKDASLGSKGSSSLIGADLYSQIEITNTTFTGNGWSVSSSNEIVTYCLFFTDQATYVRMDNCTVTDNSAKYLIWADGGGFDITNSTFTDNLATVFDGYAADVGTFADCVFNNNPANKWSKYSSFNFTLKKSNVHFAGCNFGNSTFSDRSCATFENSEGDAVFVVGSIFGEGSLTMVVACAALIASVASIAVTVAFRKKQKSAFATAGGAAETEDEE